MKKKKLCAKLSLHKKTIILLSCDTKSAIIGGQPDRITLVSVFNPCNTFPFCAVSIDCQQETCLKTGCQELTVLTIRNANCNVPA